MVRFQTTLCLLCLLPYLITFIQIYRFAISILYRYPSLTAAAVAAARNAYNVGQGNKEEEKGAAS